MGISPNKDHLFLFQHTRFGGFEEDLENNETLGSRHKQKSKNPHTASTLCTVPQTNHSRFVPGLCQKNSNV
jgi:hypothetical protein